MKFKPLSTRRMQVAEGLHLPVSRHFFYTYFGVRGRYDTKVHTGTYVNTGTPGTGFFVRDSDSQSYRRFVRAIKKKQGQNLFTLLFGKEFSFDKEIAAVEAALKNETNNDKIEILSSYQSALLIAKDEELVERIVRAIKDKIGHHPNKYLVSILSHYKSRIASLEHEVKGAQYNIKDHMPETDLAAWGKVIETFREMADSRRIWQVVTEKGESSYLQVFFDTGIFDFVQSPYDTPIFRTFDGICYYIYPNYVIRARTSVDFDILPINDVMADFAIVDINTLAVRPELYAHAQHSNKSHHQPTDALSTLYGTTRAQEVGELVIPALGLTFLINHPKKVADFVNAIKEFKLNQTK